MSQAKRVKSPQLKLEYDEDDEKHIEVPQMRARMDTPEAGSTSSMSELQTEPLGYSLPVGRISILKSKEPGYSAHLERRLIYESLPGKRTTRNTDQYHDA